MLESVRHTRADRQARVRDGHAREPFRKRGHETKPDQPAPVLAEQGDVVELHGDQPIAHPFDVPFERVVALFGGLVRFAEADQIGRHRAVPFGGETGNHLAIKE